MTILHSADHARGSKEDSGMADKKGSNVHGSNAGSESSERYRPSLAAKPKSPSSPIVYVSSKTETSNPNSVDIPRRSFIGPSKVAERYGANAEESPIDLGTEIPQPSRPSFRTTKSTSSTPTKKDTGQNQEPYFRSSSSSNKPSDRSLSSNISNLTSKSPPISVSTAFSSTGPLQTQLALRTELCEHYEADLKARDEVVEILCKKLADLEKDDTKRKNALRSWKKKVQELERVCRQLEKTVEESKQESMERSIMDEASGEALRMLHRQIASLERERNEWSKREQGLLEETLENLAQDRSQDIMKLKGAVELELQQEIEESQTKYESLQVQKAERDEQLEQTEQQLKFRDDEYTTLKAELEAHREEKAEADVEIKTSRDRIVVLKEEVERLRRHVHSLQQESADKEVKIVQMTKQRSLDKEDIQGLNIALDSKQQELELLKRKSGVKGTAGSTPAQQSKVPRRRDSSIFTATPVLSRPPSVISDSGTEMHIPKKERKLSSETASSSVKPLALGKSTRLNGSGVSSVSSSANRSVARAGTDGSMGPPPLKSCPSVIDTPTPSAKSLSLSRSSSARPTVTTPVLRRRASSSNSEHKMRTVISRAAVNASPAPSVLEQDEKENVADGSTASSRKRSMIATLA